MSFECEFCKYTFSTKSSLNYHQKNAKFCLDIQKKNNILLNIKREEFSCTYCNKIFDSSLI